MYTQRRFASTHEEGFHQRATPHTLRPRRQPHTATATANNTTTRNTHNTDHTASKRENHVSLLSLVVFVVSPWFLAWCLYFKHASKKHCHLLFCHGHWLLEGSKATIKPHTTRPKPRSNHEPSRVKPNRTTKPSRAEPSQAKPSQAKPSQAKPCHTTPHHTTPVHATPKQATPETCQAEPSQAISSRPFPVSG